MKREEAKAEAEKIKETFAEFSGDFDPNDTTQCAIIHVKGILKENAFFSYKISPLIVHRRKHWQEILTKLENR